jgi:hypothetical protein
LILVFQPIHGDIELIKISVTKQIIVDKVELSPGVSEGVSVAFSREIHPSDISHARGKDLLGMSELVAFEIEICFAA